MYHLYFFILFVCCETDMSVFDTKQTVRFLIHTLMSSGNIRNKKLRHNWINTLPDLKWEQLSESCFPPSKSQHAFSHFVSHSLTQEDTKSLAVLCFTCEYPACIRWLWVGEPGAKSWFQARLCRRNVFTRHPRAHITSAEAFITQTQSCSNTHTHTLMQNTLILKSYLFKLCPL